MKACLKVTVPKAQRNSLDTIIKIVFDKPMTDIEPVTSK